ncbi:MAG: hypothetical protein EBT15_05900 [Betaproteobacteria bacterium]|nr:hypothetical protein [Betaproteobacteria bacterium]
MADYKATPEQWVFHCDAQSACILELRARVEQLEAKYETQRLATLEWGQQVDKHDRWIDEHLKRIMALEAAQQDKLDRLIAQDRDDAPDSAGLLVERAADKISKPLQLTPEQAQQISDLLAPNSKPTPNPSQIRSSLVERVAWAVWGYDAPENTARAAIREVAEWLNKIAACDSDYAHRAAALLKQEAER